MKAAAVLCALLFAGLLIGMAYWAHAAKKARLAAYGSCTVIDPGMWQGAGHPRPCAVEVILEGADGRRFMVALLRDVYSPLNAGEVVVLQVNWPYDVRLYERSQPLVVE